MYRNQNELLQMQAAARAEAERARAALLEAADPPDGKARGVTIAGVVVDPALGARSASFADGVAAGLQWALGYTPDALPAHMFPVGVAGGDKGVDAFNLKPHRARRARKTG